MLATKTISPDEKSMMQGLKIGFALTGSHCTLEKALAAMECLRELGAEIMPIVSPAMIQYDTRFGSAESWRERLLKASGQEHLIESIPAAEPIGPQALLDVLLIAPCSGNTLAKLANGITDTAVLMAAKAHLRNLRPLVLAVSTNDGLGANAKNIGLLLNSKHLYFVPFGQDDASAKPNSLSADMAYIPQTIAAALRGQQLQPILLAASQPVVKSEK